MRILQIFELEYDNMGMVVTLFECEWCDINPSNKGIEIDKYGYVSLNFMKKLKTDEPYVLASQTGQVYYIRDSRPHRSGDWNIAVKYIPRERCTLMITTTMKSHINIRI